MPRNALALPLAALALACAPAPTEDPLAETLQGTWSVCANHGTTDIEERIAFADDRITWTISTFETTDGSCGGAPVTTTDLSGWFALGDGFEATLEGQTVIARGIDVTDATHTFYTTVYLDAAGQPVALYLGEPDPTSGRDMTSGAKRPVVLSSWKPLLKQ
jgi:hypothetical protein